MKSEYDFRSAKRGAVDAAPKGQTRVTIRLDDDVLDWFRAEVDAAGGGNYQTLVNNALREYVEVHREDDRHVCENRRRARRPVVE